MIWGITGNIGEGKNTFAVGVALLAKATCPKCSFFNKEWIKNICEKCGGVLRDIFANFELKNGLGKKLSVYEFLALRPTGNRMLMIIDEPYDWGLEARRSGGDLVIEITHKALQSRKIGLDIIFITQLFSTIERRFRQICQFIIFAYHANKDRFKYYMLTRKGARYRILKKDLCEQGIFPFFNTLEVVQMDEEQETEITA